jgi:hypothetical protein
MRELINKEAKGTVRIISRNGNNTSHLQVLVLKLSHKLRDKWRTVTEIIHEEKECVVTFKDLVLFVDKQARIVSNPKYDNLQDLNGEEGKSTRWKQ